jgi:hypothetical protein
MKEPTSQPPFQLRITAPCPKQWEELVGGEARRYCDQCSLHVLNASLLTQSQAKELVQNAKERVCMRIQYDASGAPIHRREGKPGPWTLAAFAGLLAACQGQEGGATQAPSTPADPPAHSTQLLGEVYVAPGPEMVGGVLPPEELGDVAQPPPLALLGSPAVLPEQPDAAPAPPPAPGASQGSPH